jgi:hypothetical protein
LDLFQALTALRGLNLALAITNKPGVMVIAVLYVLQAITSLYIYFADPVIPGASYSFVWSMTTLVLNRALLHVRRVEVMEAFATEWPEVRTSEMFDRSSLDEWDLEEIQEFEVPWGNAEGLLDGKSPIIIELWQKRDEPTKVSESRTSIAFFLSKCVFDDFIVRPCDIYRMVLKDSMDNAT